MHPLKKYMESDFNQWQLHLFLLPRTAKENKKEKKKEKKNTLMVLQPNKSLCENLAYKKGKK